MWNARSTDITISIGQDSYELKASLAVADHLAANTGSDELDFDALIFGDCTDDILNLEFLDDADLWPASSSMDISIPVGVVS